MNTNYEYCNIVGQTDIGRKRKANEDSGGHFITINGYVAVVCDGMGGHVGGAVASTLAINAIREFLSRDFIADPRIAIGMAIQTANEAILNKARIEPELAGMGSTCVLLLIRDGKVFIGHVGDSRIYLIREKKIIQLTKDHSFVQNLVDLGQITKEQAEHHPRKNEITNALGIPNMAPATVRQEAIEPLAGDCFLLCSDGLSGMVPDKNIEKIVSRQRDYSTQQRADLLVKTANENGGIDNITVELVEFTITPQIALKTSSGNKAKKRTILLFSTIAATAIVAVGIILALLPGKEINTVSFILKSIIWSEGNIAYEISGKTIFSPLTNETIDVGFDIDSIHTNLDMTYEDSTYIIRFPQKDKLDTAFIKLYGNRNIAKIKAPIQHNQDTVRNNLPPYTWNKGQISELAIISRMENRLVINYGDHSYLIEGEINDITIYADLPQKMLTDTHTIILEKGFDKDKVIISFTCDKTPYEYIIPISVNIPTPIKHDTKNPPAVDTTLIGSATDTIPIHFKAKRDTLNILKINNNKKKITFKLGDYEESFKKTYIIDETEIIFEPHQQPDMSYDNEEIIVTIPNVNGRLTMSLPAKEESTEREILFYIEFSFE